MRSEHSRSARRPTGRIARARSPEQHEWRGVAQIPHDCEADRQRNLIERMFARLKDFNRVATRYDKLARNFLAGLRSPPQ